MQLPIINKLTGTMPSDLLEDYLQVKRHLQDAAASLSSVWPHGRDYQGGDINVAMREHADRCAKIRQVIAEIEIIAESLV